MAKILVVDDDMDVRELISIALKTGGHEVIPATNGEEAVAFTSKEQPDLVLLDVRLPLIGGFDACRMICTNPATKHIPVVFMTARGQIDEIRQGLEAGAVDYYVKPFALDALLKRINDLLVIHS
jgi:DNA-binding response OmpR family regulator